MVIACWPYEVYINFRVGQLQYMHRPQSIIYKINKFVLGTLSSYLVLLNTRVIFCSIIGT